MDEIESGELIEFFPEERAGFFRPAHATRRTAPRHTALFGMAAAAGLNKPRVGVIDDQMVTRARHRARVCFSDEIMLAPHRVIGKERLKTRLSIVRYR